MTAASEKGRGSNGPIVAIMGNPDSQTVEWMLRQRRPGDVAVAFMVQTESAPTVLERSSDRRASSPIAATAERLTNAGWLIVPVRSDDDHAAAWDAVVFETGRSRVGY